jgi:hypothetical protein
VASRFGYSRVPPHPDLLPPGEGTAAAEFREIHWIIKKLAALVLPENGERIPLSQRERAGVRENAISLQSATDIVKPR